MPLIEGYVIVTILTTVVPFITNTLTLAYLSGRASAGDHFEDLTSKFEHDRNKSWLKRGPIATVFRRANLYLIRKTTTDLKPEVDTKQLMLDISEACSMNRDKGDGFNPHARAAQQRDTISDATKASVAGTGLGLKVLQPSKRDKGEIAGHQSYHLKDALVYPYDVMRSTGKRSGGKNGDVQGVTMCENVFQYYTEKAFGQAVGRGDVVIGSDMIPLTPSGEECEMTFYSDSKNNLIVNGPYSGPWVGRPWDLGGCEENLYLFDVSKGAPFHRRVIRYATGIKRKILMRCRVFRPFKDNPSRCVTIWEPICRFSTYDTPFHKWEATDLKRVDLQQWKSQFVKGKEWNVRMYKDGVTNTEIVSCAKPNNKAHVEFKRETFENMLGMRQAYNLNTILSSAGVRHPVHQVAYTSLEVELAKQLFNDLAKERDYKDYPAPFVTSTGAVPNLYISSQVVFSGTTVEPVMNWMASAGCPLQNAAHVPNQRDPNSQYDGIMFRNQKGRNSAEMIHLPLPLTLALSDVLPDPTKVVNLHAACRWCFTCKAYHVNSARNFHQLRMNITRKEEMMHAGEVHQLALDMSECACHEDADVSCVRCDAIAALVTQLVAAPCVKACHDFGHAGDELNQTSRKFFSDVLRAIHDDNWKKSRENLQAQGWYDMPDLEPVTFAKLIAIARKKFVRIEQGFEDEFPVGRGCANCLADMPTMGRADPRVTEASFCVPVKEALCEHCLAAIPECVANSTTLTPNDISFQTQIRPTAGKIGPLPPVVDRDEVVTGILNKDPKFETLGPRHGIYTKKELATYVWRNFNPRGTPHPYMNVHEAPCDAGNDCWGLRSVGVCKYKHTQDEIETNFHKSPIAPRVSPPRPTAKGNIHAWARVVGEVWGVTGSDKLGDVEYPFKAWDNDQIMEYFKKAKHKNAMRDYEYLVTALYDDEEDHNDLSKRALAADRFAEAVWSIKDFVPTGSPEDVQQCREILARVGFKGGIEAFLKSEASGGFPRIISSWRDFHFIAEHTRYMAPITTWFKEHHGQWFMPGKTPPELAAAISEFINSVNGAEVESDDYSNFDMLRSGALQQVVSLALMEGMPQTEQAAYVKMMNEVMSPEGGARMKMNTGDEFIIFHPGEGQKSGNAGTTGDNTLCCGALNILAIFLVLGGWKGMAAMHTTYKRAQSKMVHNIRRHLSPCSGDDAVSSGKIAAMKKTVAKSLGMELTTEHVYNKDGYVVFLQRVYCFLETENPHFTIFSPNRQLPKIHLRRNPDDSNFFDIATLQGHELLVNDPWTPIVSNFARALIANYQRYCTHSYKAMRDRHSDAFYAGASDRSYNYALSITGGPWPSDIKEPHYQTQARLTIANMIGTTASEVLRVDLAFGWLAEHPQPVARSEDFVGRDTLVKGKFYVPAQNLNKVARLKQVEHLMKVYSAGKMPNHWKGDPKDFYNHPLYCVPPIQNEMSGKGMTWDGYLKPDDPQRRLKPEQSAAYAQLLADFAAKRGATSSVRYLFSGEILALVFGAAASAPGNAPNTTSGGEDGGEDARCDPNDAEEQEDTAVPAPGRIVPGAPRAPGPQAGSDTPITTSTAHAGPAAPAHGPGGTPSVPVDNYFRDVKSRELGSAGTGGGPAGGDGRAARAPAPSWHAACNIVHKDDHWNCTSAPMVDQNAPSGQGFEVRPKTLATCLMCGEPQISLKTGKKVHQPFPWCDTHYKELPECAIAGCKERISNPSLLARTGHERVCQRHAVKPCSICNKLILPKSRVPEGTAQHAAGDPACMTADALNAKFLKLAGDTYAGKTPAVPGQENVKGRKTDKTSDSKETKIPATNAPKAGTDDKVHKKMSSEAKTLSKCPGNSFVVCREDMLPEVRASADGIDNGLTIAISCERLTDNLHGPGSEGTDGLETVRQMPNPFRDLKEQGLERIGGTDPRVQEIVWKQRGATKFRTAALARVLATLDSRTLPPSSVTIIVSCAHGVHRSQALASWLLEQLAANNLKYTLTIARKKTCTPDKT